MLHKNTPLQGTSQGEQRHTTIFTRTTPTLTATYIYTMAATHTYIQHYTVILHSNITGYLSKWLTSVIHTKCFVFLQDTHILVQQKTGNYIMFLFFTNVKLLSLFNEEHVLVVVQTTIQPTETLFERRSWRICGTNDAHLAYKRVAPIWVGKVNIITWIHSLQEHVF